jgi:hypothetical protein
MNNKWPWLAINIWIPILGLGGGFISSVAYLILVVPGLIEVNKIYFNIFILKNIYVVNSDALTSLQYMHGLGISLGILIISTLFFFLNDCLNPDSPS